MEIPSFSLLAPVKDAINFLPADGQGLNPLLRHPGMVIHPPMLYLGFVSFVIPYAFAIAALVTGRTDEPLDPPHPTLDPLGMALPFVRTRAGRALGL